MSQYLTLFIYAAYPRFPSHPSELCTLHINLIHLASIFDLMFRTLLLCPEIANQEGGGGGRLDGASQVTRWQDLWITKEFISFREPSRAPTLSSFVFVRAENTFPCCVARLRGVATAPNCNLLVQAVKNQLQAMCGCEMALTFYFLCSSCRSGPSWSNHGPGQAPAITGAVSALRKHNFRTLSRT